MDSESFLSSWFNAVVSLLILYVLFLVVPALINWAFFNAVWTGTPDDCRSTQNGACWAFVGAKIELFTYGFYTKSERWRVDIFFLVLTLGIGWLVFEKTPGKKYVGLFMLLVFPVMATILLTGGLFGLEAVPTKKWGGLLLTLVIALVGIVLSMPLGILLALGRRSKMPLVSSMCVVFIEFWRGVPLITVLFMASVMFPLFVPEGMDVNDLVRALLGVALFSSAYMAEVVRGGLQAIGKGQYEASGSLGLNYFQRMRLVVLPQALKIVIPGIVNTFIGLFKDTTLVLIIGFFDLLGIVQAGQADPKWSGYSIPYTAYAFCAVVFFIFCFLMSVYSKKVESKLHTGHQK